MAAPTLRQLTRVFLRTANTTFGGGTPTVAALQRELVEQHEWLSPEDYGLAFALARITPGTNVIAFCTAAGSRILGMRGAIAGALSETLPSAILAVLITQGYETWRTNAVVMAAVAGTIAAVAGMMWSSVWLMVKPHCGNLMRGLRTACITGGAFIALWRFGLSPLTIIGIAAAVGLVWQEPAARTPKAAP